VEEFPYLLGRVSLSANQAWSMHLPIVFKMRIEDGQMVLWRPGFTIFLSIWNNDHGETTRDRLEHFKAHAADSAYDLREGESEDFLRFSYRLSEESEDERVAAFYCFVFGDNGHVQLSMYFDDEPDSELSMYFDDEPDSELAEFLLAGISDLPPDMDDVSVLSDLCFVTQALMDESGELGVMYRDEAESSDVSGWEFFTGRESADYLEDADNVSMCEVAFVAERFPAIIPHLNAAIGSEFLRTADGMVRSGG
jgi:hypothetical protein